jgi:hypothetical protein
MGHARFCEEAPMDQATGSSDGVVVLAAQLCFNPLHIHWSRSETHQAVLRSTNPRDNLQTAPVSTADD